MGTARTDPAPRPRRTRAIRAGTAPRRSRRQDRPSTASRRRPSGPPASGRLSRLFDPYDESRSERFDRGERRPVDVLDLLERDWWLAVSTPCDECAKLFPVALVLRLQPHPIPTAAIEELEREI